MENKETKAQRLCSEIQLFDLCSEDACKHRNGRFCTKEDVLARFEAISEEELSPEMYISEDLEEDEGPDDLDDDAFDADDCGDEEIDEEY